MDLAYALTPMLAWLVAGGLKFAINCVRARRLAFDLIGYGGLPSNHSAIVTSMAALVALREGPGHPAFGVAVTLAFIVVLDANGLRRQVGKQAAALNALAGDRALRERMGHSRFEILAGIAVGAAVAAAVHAVMA